MEQVETNRKPYVIMLVLGLVMLAFSTWIAHEYREFRHEVESTTGTVTEIVTEEIAGAERERAVITFSDTKGATHKFRIPVAGTFFDYSTGENVTVVYDPALPSAASVDGFWPTWTLIMLCFVVSYLVIVLFMWAYYRIRYRNFEAD